MTLVQAKACPAYVTSGSVDVASRVGRKDTYLRLITSQPILGTLVCHQFSPRSRSLNRIKNLRGRGERWGCLHAQTKQTRGEFVHLGPSEAVGSNGTASASINGREVSNEGIYTPFIDYAVEQLGKRMELRPFPLAEEFVRLDAVDKKGQRAVTDSTALQAAKLRQIRAANIQAGNTLQVLNFIVFPRPEYDLPYFCADLVTLPRGHLILIDLNPLYNTPAYLTKYIKPLLPITNNFSKVLPWGGEFTAESLQFFSPALLWTRPEERATVDNLVFQAYKAYFDYWLDLVEAAEPERDPAVIARNQEEQHKYICWRCEKDPGRPVITRLYGTELCEAYIHRFLFDGISTLGNKTFLDYFPEYRNPDGSVNKKRSMAGKMCANRPWDEHGNFLGAT